MLIKLNESGVATPDSEFLGTPQFPFPPADTTSHTRELRGLCSSYLVLSSCACAVRLARVGLSVSSTWVSRCFWVDGEPTRPQ